MERNSFIEFIEILRTISLGAIELPGRVVPVLKAS